MEKIKQNLVIVSISTILLILITSCKKEKVNFNFAKTFSGKIDNKYSLEMDLKCNDGIIKGTYFYNSYGIDIKINGLIRKDSSVTLKEFDDKGNKTGTWIGKMIDSNNIVGVWLPNDNESAKDFKIKSSVKLQSSLKQTNPKLLINEIKLGPPGKRNEIDNPKTIQVNGLTVSFKGKNQSNGELVIINNNTNAKLNLYYEFDETPNLKDNIHFEDFDHDGQDELIIPILLGGSSAPEAEVFDYETLQPKAIFEVHNYSESSSEEIYQTKNFTNSISFGDRCFYNFKEDKSLSFGCTCGAICTAITTYELINGVYYFKYNEIIERIEEGVKITKTDKDNKKTIRIENR